MCDLKKYQLAYVFAATYIRTVRYESDKRFQVAKF